MDLSLICGALEIIQRDYHIPNPLKGRESIMGGNLNARNVSKYYPKPQQEEMYYFISGFLRDRFNVSIFTKIGSLFNRSVKRNIEAYKKIYGAGMLARNNYNSRLDGILGCDDVVG